MQWQQSPSEGQLTQSSYLGVQCPLVASLGAREGIEQTLNFQKTMAELEADPGVLSPACLPCPNTALWYQPSVSLAPFQGWGLQRGRVAM